MKLALLVLIQIMLWSSVTEAARYCKTSRQRTYAEQIATLEPSADLDLMDLELFPGGSVVAGYEYDVEPAFTKGLYARTDSWLIQTKALPATDINLSEGIESRVSAGLENQTIATFTRFFKDPCHAMMANPYSPRRIPLKAKVALGPKFKMGDYFLFRGSVGFVASAEILGLIGSSFWGVGLSGSYLLEGFYQLHIVRLSENEVRLKIVAHRGKKISASIGLGYEHEFDVFGVSLLDNELERLVNTKPVKIRGDITKSNVFMIDYILNLTDSDVVRAFEKVLPKVKEFKKIKLTGPFRNRKDLEQNLILDLSPLEDLYRRDFSQNRSDRIKRNLKTSSEQNAYGFGIHAGNKILGFKLDKGVSTAKMSIMQENDVIQRFLLKSWERNWDGRFLFSWLRSVKESGFRALFTADADFQKLIPVNMVKFKNHKKTRFSFRDFQILKIDLRKSLPIHIFNQIPFKNWGQRPGEKFQNFGLRFELLMAPESILESPKLSHEEVKIFYLDHLKSKDLSYKDFYSDRTDDDHFPKAKDSFNLELNQMARFLSQALNSDLPDVERLDMITKLRGNKLFAETGISFLMSLRPDKMKQNYHLDLDISANEALIDFSFGEAEISNLYKKILTIKVALDDDALDLLGEAESISFPIAQ